MDFAIDLETLGRVPGCVIVSIGAQGFNVQDDDVQPEAEFYATLNMEEQLLDGRTICPATLFWWMQQEDRSVFQECAERGQTLSSALKDLYQYFCKFGTDESLVWSIGADFDIAMVKYALHQVRHLSSARWPFAYDAARDVRTLCHTVGFDRRRFQVDGLRKHHAFDDAKYAALCVQEATAWGRSRGLKT